MCKFPNTAFSIVATAWLAGIITFAAETVYSNDKEFSSWHEACSAAEAVVAEGDIIFLDVPYMLFRNVAKSTRSWTSHVGIVFKNEEGEWIVSESTVPVSKESSLCRYLKGSRKYHFEIKRFHRPLSSEETDSLRSAAHSMMGRFYTTGFDFDSSKLYCSKFVYLAYQAIGIDVGRVQTFQDLLRENPQSSLTFWKWWFFGSVPWERRTITPASQLSDPNFVTIMTAR